MDTTETFEARRRYPTVVERGERERSLKNSGWLLRHWGEVRHFTLRTTISGVKLQGTLLVAWLASGPDDSFSEGWVGDVDDVLTWLRRPVFHGLKVFIDPPNDATKADTCGGRKVEL